ncbi:MAG: glycosyltransferase family 4 protein, partial [Pseudomonadales bacterium]
MRILTMIREIQRMGIQISFLYMEVMESDTRKMAEFFDGRYYQITHKTSASTTALSGVQKLCSCIFLTSFRYNIFADDWYDDSIQNVITDIGSKLNPDIVLTEYVFTSKALECFPDTTLKLVDTHDIFGNRYKHFLKQGIEPNWISVFPKDEIRCLRRADYVIAIQREEAAYFSKYLTNRVVTVGHVSPVKKIKAARDNHNILFVGGINAVNLDAVYYFITEVFPIVRKHYPQAKLVLVGAICEKTEDFPGLEKKQEIEEYEDIYSLARVAINPCRFGTGLKIKNVEAMGYGKALVTTTVGAAGLEHGIDKAFLVADDANGFALKIKR